MTRRATRAALLAALIFLAGAAAGVAAAPETSLFPRPRPSLAAAVAAALASVPVAPQGPTYSPAYSPSYPTALAPFSSLRPTARDGAVVAALPPPVLPPLPRAGQAPGTIGPVCGDRRIAGTPVAAVTSATSGCGIAAPVRVSQVAGVRLSTAATLDCTAARALADWVEDAVQPAARRRGSPAAELTVFAHYSCRTRNNQPGARISEHGRGRAVDIGALTLADGRRITVLDGWGGGRDGRLLTRMREGACGPFTTVLGPGSDRYHRDHLHLDTAPRSRPYCE